MEVQTRSYNLRNQYFKELFFGCLDGMLGNTVKEKRQIFFICITSALTDGQHMKYAYNSLERNDFFTRSFSQTGHDKIFLW
jgi:hypothetical protein